MNDEQRDKIARRSALRRLADVEDVAHAVELSDERRRAATSPARC